MSGHTGGVAADRRVLLTTTDLPAYIKTAPLLRSIRDRSTAGSGISGA
jgi:hypothetical protein